MMKRALVLALSSIGLPTLNCFSLNCLSLRNNVVLNADESKTILKARSENISRSSFIASSAALLVQSPALISNALTDEIGDSETPIREGSEILPTTKSRTIEGCPNPTPGQSNNCVATTNIKQLATYVPPWTFQVSPDVAFAKLKEMVADDPTYTVVESDESSLYLKVNVKRNFNTEDVMEFLVKRDDKVVIFKSYEKDPGLLSDFNANRIRIINLHNKSSGVFRVMGYGLTADATDGGAGGKRNGALGQLKAFYGLQSGQGYQEVFDEL